MKPLSLDELKTKMLSDAESVQAYNEADQELMLIQALAVCWLVRASLFPVWKTSLTA